jgi:hypothetical protein
MGGLMIGLPVPPYREISFEVILFRLKLKLYPLLDTLVRP